MSASVASQDETNITQILHEYTSQGPIAKWNNEPDFFEKCVLFLRILLQKFNSSVNGFLISEPIDIN